MSDSGITREEAEAMGLIDHDEEARRHAAAVEELTRLRNEHEAPSPASPSGNRHDGVRLHHDECEAYEWRWTEVGNGRWLDLTHVAYPVDIDAARTAVIEAARGVVAAPYLRAALDRLDALTTKGATT